MVGRAASAVQAICSLVSPHAWACTAQKPLDLFRARRIDLGVYTSTYQTVVPVQSGYFEIVNVTIATAIGT